MVDLCLWGRCSFYDDIGIAAYMERVFMIKIENLTFGYPQADATIPLAETLVINAAELCIGSGLWLLDGKNGSGKTTLMNILAATAESRVKMGINNDTIINCSSNLIHVKNDLTLPNKREKDCAEYIFWLNDIKPDEPYIPLYKNATLAAYSLGEKKTAALHMLSYLRPDVLLIDEYINNLDVDNLEQVFIWLKQTASDGSIVIVASNEEDIKRRFYNRIEIRDKKLLAFSSQSSEKLRGI